MPTHVYHPSRNPPSLWDRFLVHPWDNVMGFLVAAVGLLLGVSGIFPVDTGPFQNIEGMVAVISTGIVLLVGGILAIVGLHWEDDDNVARGWQIERTGWILVSGGALSYLIAVLATDIDSALSSLTTIAILAGSSVTALSRWYIELATRRRGDDLKDRGADL